MEQMDESGQVRVSDLFVTGCAETASRSRFRTHTRSDMLGELPNCIVFFFSGQGPSRGANVECLNIRICYRVTLCGSIGACPVCFRVIVFGLSKGHESPVSFHEKRLITV